MSLDPNEVRGSTGTPSVTAVDSSAAEKYEVLVELGRGGSGVVSLALSRGIGGFNKLVVLKTIKDDLRDREAYGKMFLEEAKLAARMSHPNVVQTYEVYKHKGLPVIVMEYLEGQAFSEVRRRAVSDPRLDENMTISILCKVLAGLHYAHTLRDFRGTALKLVHRDATPHNVLVTYQGQVKLLDFGIAKLNASRERTNTGVIKGKLDYMPPEQLQGDDLDCRSDLFAVGIMLWEGIARRRLWGDANDGEVMRRLLNGDIPSIREACPDLDPELARICEHALAPDPDARYADADAFRADLERYLATRGGLVPDSVIGQLVTETCAEPRQRLQASLDSKLRRLTADPATGEEIQRALESLRVRGVDAAELATTSARTIELPRRERRRWGWGLAAGGFAAALALLGYFGWAPRSAAWARTTAADVVVAPSAEAALRNSSSAQATARPRIPEPPAAKAVPQDFKAEGTTTEKIPAPSTSEPHARVLKGGPLGALRSGVTSGSAPAVSAAAGGRNPPPKVSTNACDPLYVIDEFGIKRYRRECLPGAGAPHAN
ncbi:MAG TPA: protein kinase [Polyangiaceae bacterium]|nr:protein kinase [Polyangiaceae bacterium]